MVSENSQWNRTKPIILRLMTKDDTYFAAMQARDHRFDGKFFVGVKTTGIYCRPICPAKPLRKNVEFFTTHLEAEKSGYRPCLRCRPESAPQSPVWIGQSAMVRRAIRMIGGLRISEFNEDQFADLLGVSARHLRRTFVDEIGKTPKQLFFENRLNLARKLLVETNLPISELAFAAGFSSIRRFNDSFRDRFTKSPSQIRRKPILGKFPLTVSLAYRPPYDYAGLLDFYQSHRMGDLERFENQKMHRVIHLDGMVGEVAISDDPANSRLMVEIDFPDTSQIHFIIARVRALFDLDSDPVVVANVLESDAKLKKILSRHSGIRMPSGWDPFEVAISTILGQLVSVKMANKLVSDLIDLAGRDSGLKTASGKSIKLFPTPKELLNADLSKLGTTGRRKETIKRFCDNLVEGKLSLESTQDVDLFLKSLLSIRGIGPWTAQYITMKALRHTDTFPETDLILARALEIHPKHVVNAMSPWRGYVAALFWKEYSTQLTKMRSKVRKKN